MFICNIQNSTILEVEVVTQLYLAYKSSLRDEAGIIASCKYLYPKEIFLYRSDQKKRPASKTSKKSLVPWDIGAQMKFTTKVVLVRRIYEIIQKLIKG